jgi:hypothetical protein
MNLDAVALVNERLREIDRRLSDIRSETESLEVESAKLTDFLLTIEALSKAVLSTPTKPKVTVRKGSWAAKAAQYLKNGSLPYRQVVSLVVEAEKGCTRDPAERKRVSNLVATAIWRRGDDLFLRDGDSLSLRTKDFELVDPDPDVDG